MDAAQIKVGDTVRYYWEGWRVGTVEEVLSNGNVRIRPFGTKRLTEKRVRIVSPTDVKGLEE